MRISDWSSDVCSSDLQFQVTAPDDVTDNDVFQFKATAKAEETPEDAECDTENNVATDDASAYIYGEAAGEPTVGLQVSGEGVVKEDTPTDVSITAGVTTAGATLTRVVKSAERRDGTEGVSTGRNGWVT